MKIFSVIIIILLITLQKTNAQEAISVSYNYGTIAIHSPSIADLVNGPVHGFTINYAISNKTGVSWRKLYNFPDYGISYNYKSYHNTEQLGSSHSLTGFYQMPFLPKGRFFNFGFKGFAGMGFFTKKYDPVTNPLNKAISSTINISAEVRLYGKIRIEPLFFEYSIGLNHFSNGLVKAPNLGINVLNNSFSIGYELEEKLPYEKLRRQKITKDENHEFWAVTSVGMKEIDLGSRKYVFSSISINYSKYITKINKLGIGFDFLNDPSLTPIAYEKYYYLGKPDLNFRYGINLHNEFMFGKTGFFVAYGKYLRESSYYSSPWYYKAGFKYYYRNFIGIVLIRAIPLFRADVVEFGLGYRISKNKKKL